MARIRSVHPGLFTDEAFVELSMAARVLFIGLWTECDDQGVFEWKPRTIKMRLLAADTVEVEPLLAELVAVGGVRRYEVDGRQYGAVRNFARFQRPKKPNAIHPLPAEFRTYVGSSEVSSEPGDDEGGSGSPPGASGRDPVPKTEEPDLPQPPSVPPKSEKPNQMEDGGGRREREEEDLPLTTLAPSPAMPARPQQGGVAEVIRGRDAAFERWWLAYPRKVGKGAARKAWQLAEAKVGGDLLLAAVHRQRWADDPRFIPHPATWLNGERWADDPGAAAPPHAPKGDMGWMAAELGIQPVPADHHRPIFDLEPDDPEEPVH